MNLSLLKFLSAKNSQRECCGDSLKKRGMQMLKSVAMTLLFVAISSAAFAQGRSVSGTVVDTDGLPLPGVTVMIAGTTNGTITGIDGDYSIAHVTDTSALEFSYIGYETITVVPGNKTKMNVTLESASKNIDEVVVVGYGVQKKETLTGSIVQVKADEALAGKSTSSALGSLQGEVPGLTYTRTSSRPGNEDEKFLIRGDMSVNKITPLILLDGVEVSSAELSSINSNDIESFSVLKDGSAAIFGTKAAGGVILVTTKKGVAGDVKVELNAEFQLNIPQKLPICDIYEYAEIMMEGYNNSKTSYVDVDGNTQEAVFAPNAQTFLNPVEAYEQLLDGVLPEGHMAAHGQYVSYDDVDWFDEYYGVTLTERYNVAISGGTDKLTTRTSIGYANERSALQVAYDGQKKYNFRTNMSYKPNDIITADFNASYDVRNNDVPTSGVGHGVQDPWIWPMYNQNGQLYSGWFAASNSPLAQMQQGGRTTAQNSITNIGGKITADLNKFVEGLSFSYQGNASYRLVNKTIRDKAVTVYNWDGSQSNQDITPEKTSVEKNLTTVFFQNHTIQGNWLRSFGKNNVGLMVGMTSELYQKSLYKAKRTGMASAELDDINLGNASTATNYGASNANGLVSYLARLNYDYAGIVMAEGSFRRDGSSRLSPENRWSNFLYGSAGIRLSELDSFKGGFFDNLKLYTSYGETGSTTGIGDYDYFSTIATGTRYFGVEDGVAIENTSNVGAMTTTDRTWERVAKTNFGVDFSILDSRLSGTMEYYMNRNKDMLISITYPSVLGGKAPKTNSGDFKVNGWEVSLNWRDNINKDFSYFVGVAAWDSRSVVESMEGANVIKAGVNATIEGQPLGAIYAYKGKIMQTEAEVLDYYKANYFADPNDHNSKKPGDNKLNSLAYNTQNRLIPGCVAREDISGDGLINTDDLYMVGDDRAHYSYSLNFGFKYKNFDFSAFFQGVGQQHIVRGGSLAYPFKAPWMNQNNCFAGNCWSPENTGSENPIILASSDGARRSWNWLENDINIVNASYLRAKTISLGYNVPKSAVNKIGLEGARFSVSGNDLFCISNVNDGLDPEFEINAHNGDMIPFNSTVLFNVQLTF